MERVFIGMSGGVDSSVAAALLKERGYDIVGVTLRLKPGDGADGDIEDAKNVAKALKIEHCVLDLRGEFKEKVMDYFAAEYLRGATPNPCVVCNREIKFGAMLKFALENGGDYVATGHYASLDKSGEHTKLMRSDSAKDQSYFLCMLSEFQLAHAMFPIDGMEKSAIRALAEKFSLPVAQKKDSQEVCWLPDGDYASFIEQKLGSCPAGEFISPDGTVCGQHKGLLHYTVGQRKGLGAFGRPMFVTRILPEQNAVILGENGAQYAKEFTVEGINAISAQMSGSFDCDVKIRFRAPAAPAHVEFESENTARVTFFELQRSVTPGQFAAFYSGNEVIGGAKIAGVETQRIL